MCVVLNYFGVEHDSSVESKNKSAILKEGAKKYFV